MQIVNTDGIKILIFSFEQRKAVEYLPKTTLPYMDLTLCFEGEMHYYINGKHVILHSGDGIIFPPGSIRERLYGEKKALYASFNIRFPENAKFDICGFLPKCVNSDIIYLVESFSRDFSTVSSKKKEKCLSAFSYIYYRLCENASDDENSHVRIVKQYISDNLSEKIRLCDIASHVHLAPQYICQLFKKQTGLGITSFVNRERIDLAKRLIMTSDEPIFKIAEKCGFPDYNYFSHTFKLVTGISAQNYRKNKRK